MCCCLQPQTQKQNSERRQQQGNNTSGVRGVSWHKQRRAWRGRVTHYGRSVHVGYYATLAEADAALRQARAELFGDAG